MSSSSDPSRRIRREEEQRQARIREGMQSIDQTFAGFTPDFYNQRASDYTRFATPQLSEQANQMWRNLTGRLAGQGLLRSAAAGRLRSSLETEQGRQQQAIADESVNQANTLRRDVENQRSGLISQLYQTSDPSVTTQSALGTAASLRGPSTFAPLGGMFQNWSNLYLANQVSRSNPQLGASILTGNMPQYGVGESSRIIGR